jgi:peptidoglycan/LPS O-acetylase OafA/YrhL
MRRDTGEILPLTGLRFVAALYVFAFHIHIRWPMAENGSYVANFLNEGAVGMSLFFMLSGYILAYTYAEKNTSALMFYRNRFARIYPIYAVAALLTLPWLFQNPFSNTFSVVVLQAGVLVTADALMIQAWFPQLWAFWNNAASWSLSTEMFFYALFPLLLPAAALLNKAWLILVMAAVYVLSELPGLTYLVFQPRPTYGLQIFYAMPIFRLPEFAMGMLVYFASRRVRDSGLIRIAAPMALLMLVAYLGTVGSEIPIFVPNNWIVVPAVALLIAYLATCDSALARLLSTRPFVWSGKISYCFYSFQFFVIFSVLTVPMYFPNTGFIVFCFTFVILILISAIGYHLIEEPFRRRLHGRRAGVDLSRTS